jgi:hypothetical protein
MAGYLPTAEVMKRWKFKPDDTCPRCRQCIETTVHILQCPAVEARTLWLQKIDELQSWLLDKDTLYDLAVIICDRLRTWQNGGTSSLPPIDRFNLIRVVELQDSIGWSSFVYGFISWEWQAVQSAYLLTLNRKQSAKRWLSELIKKLWLIAWDM